MSENIDTLGDFHQAPWDAIENGYLYVVIEIDTRDPLSPISEQTDDPYEYETREGELVGRATGTGLYYDGDRHENVVTRIGPCIYISTPDDTVLEVRTDRTGNELLTFDVDGEGGGRDAE